MVKRDQGKRKCVPIHVGANKENWVPIHVGTLTMQGWRWRGEEAHKDDRQGGLPHKTFDYGEAQKLLQTGECWIQ
jgi:hypothetical protein